MATKEEKEILKKFRNNELKRYKSIKKTKDGDILYIALPTRRLESKCMRCHDTPEVAPKQLVEQYGSKAGFGEKIGNIKAIMSIEKPLNSAYKQAYFQTFKSGIYIFISVLIFLYFYYRYNKKLYKKNEELELLNKDLDEKVKDRTSELENSKKQLLNIINSSKLGYWDWNIVTNQFHVNDIWLNMIGISSKEFNNTKDEWIERIHPKDLKNIIPKIKNNFKGNNSFSIEYRMKHKNGEYIWIESVGGVVQRDSNNKVIQVCGIHRNIHQKKLNELKAYEQEKLIYNQAKVTAVGEMLKNISHQWKQPLSAITTIASTIKLSYEFRKELTGKELIEYADKILNNGNYLAKTINDFSSYFDNKKENKEETSLAKIFERIIDLIKDSYQFDNIICSCSVKDDLVIEINENLFIQALLNLFNNTQDAFNINAIDKDSRYLFISASKEESNIVVSLKDSAGGIDKNIIDKIFEPYFTTKHQSVGTGIGLYMTNQIINKHLHGTISVKNSKYVYNGKELLGCEFKIYLPYES